MTSDSNGQGIIDFDEVFPAKKKRHKKVPPSDCVPPERVKLLADVRDVCGITLRQVSENSDLSVSFLHTVLTLKRNINLEDYSRIKSALADVVFNMILDRVKGKNGYDR